MALALDNTTQNTSASSTTVTVNHTATGTNLIALAFTWHDDSLNAVSSITYDGNAMTLILDSGAIAPRISVWYYIGPATGAKDVIATRPTGTSNFQMAVHTYTGAKQSAQPDASAFQSATIPGGRSLTKSITTIADNCWLALLGSSPNGLTASTGSTEREAITTQRKSFDSNEAKTPAGSHSMAFTFASDPGTFYDILVSLAPASIEHTATTLETSTMTEAVTNPLGRLATILETTSLTETVTAIVCKIVTILDTINSSDTISSLFPWKRQSKNNATLTNQTKNTSSSS